MRRLIFKKLIFREYNFWKKSTILNSQMKIMTFYYGHYIDLICQNMHLNEKLFTGSERETVVVFEEVGRLEVKDSVIYLILKINLKI